MQLALNQVIGAYAIAVVENGNPDVIVAARKGSPLVVGVGEQEYFLASDATPIVEYTDKVVYVGEEEIVTIERGKELLIKTLSNVEKTPVIKKLELTLNQLEKGGYPHFMRMSVDIKAAHTTNTFAAIVVENNRFFTIFDQFFVQHIEHFKE